jgi:hypothetical protein
MDYQVAAQFLGTVAQVTVTLFSVYMAVIVYVFQGREVAKDLLRNNYFKMSFVMVCIAFGSEIVVLFDGFFVLSPNKSLDSITVGLVIAVFALFLTMVVLSYWAIMRRRSQPK